MIIEWAVSERAFAGAARSGDQYLVEPLPGGVLVAVVDGLGHGPEAFVAARRATEVAGQWADEPVDDILRHCHEALKGTRGAVMSLAALRADEDRMAWLGVGNVEGALFRSAPSDDRPEREALLARPGVVGYRIPSLRVAVLPIAPGDTMLFATDGIASAFLDDPPLHLSPQQLAEDTLVRFGRATDDALVLAFRYRGATP